MSTPPIRPAGPTVAAACTPSTGLTKSSTAPAGWLPAAPAVTAATAMVAVPSSSDAPTVAWYNTPAATSCAPAGTVAPGAPVTCTMPLASVAGLRGAPRPSPWRVRLSSSAVSGNICLKIQSRYRYTPYRPPACTRAITSASLRRSVPLVSMSALARVISVGREGVSNGMSGLQIFNVDGYDFTLRAPQFDNGAQGVYRAS